MAPARNTAAPSQNGPAAPAEGTPMAIDTTTPRSRRALLGAGLGAIAATVASAFGLPLPAQAEGETMHVGGDYLTATSATQLKNSTTDNDLFIGTSTGSGKGVWGKSTSGIGVQGQSESGAGVRAISSTGYGLHATSAKGNAVFAESPLGIGVYGSSLESYGVKGKSTSFTAILGESDTKEGVIGRSKSHVGTVGFSESFFGVFAQSSTGHALGTAGRVRFHGISGVATIPTGTTSVVVNPGYDVTTDSFVLLTPRANIAGRDLWFGTDATNSTITIRMSASRPKDTKISWLLLD